jgi:hypothetical protein
MGAHEPAEATRLFERLFAAGDLDRLMALYEDDAVFRRRTAPRPDRPRSVRPSRPTSTRAHSWRSENPSCSSRVTWP